MRVFRQVAQLEPLWPGPYMHGMKTAQRLHDVEGIQWATVGILSQGWPANQKDIWQTAIRVARATLEDLRAKKHTREADQFETALNAALERDCVVTVRWVGDADVNLLVEEPTGSVCSLRNYRTTAGGVLTGNLAAGGDLLSRSQGHCEFYVCPKGFSGKYKLLLRRVWGQVAAGKVHVEVVTHYKTRDSRQIAKNITLEKGEAVVQFELADGRRKEKLQDQQVANAAVGQIAVGQQILRSRSPQWRIPKPRLPPT